MGKMDLTSEEKIDLIYDMLEKQESRYKRSLIAKVLFRIFVIWAIVLFYTVLLPKLDTWKLINEYIAPRMSEIIAPIASESMKNITSNAMSWDLLNWLDSTNASTSSISDDKKAEILKKLKEMQNK